MYWATKCSVQNYHGFKWWPSQTEPEDTWAPASGWATTVGVGDCWFLTVGDSLLRFVGYLLLVCELVCCSIIVGCCLAFTCIYILSVALHACCFWTGMMLSTMTRMYFCCGIQRPSWRQACIFKLTKQPWATASICWSCYQLRFHIRLRLLIKQPWISFIIIKDYD